LRDMVSGNTAEQPGRGLVMFPGRTGCNFPRSGLGKVLAGETCSLWAFALCNLAISLEHSNSDKEIWLARHELRTFCKLNP